METMAAHPQPSWPHPLLHNLTRCVQAIALAVPGTSECKPPSCKTEAAVCYKNKSGGKASQAELWERRVQDYSRQRECVSGPCELPGDALCSAPLHSPRERRRLILGHNKTCPGGERLWDTVQQCPCVTNVLLAKPRPHGGVRAPVGIAWHHSKPHDCYTSCRKQAISLGNVSLHF